MPLSSLVRIFYIYHCTFQLSWIFVYALAYTTIRHPINIWAFTVWNAIVFRMSVCDTRGSRHYSGLSGGRLRKCSYSCHLYRIFRFPLPERRTYEFRQDLQCHFPADYLFVWKDTSRNRAAPDSPPYKFSVFLHTKGSYFLMTLALIRRDTLGNKHAMHLAG